MEIYNFASSSSGNCYLIIFKNNKKILLECGISINKIIAKLSDLSLNLNDIDACIVSHEHSDHSLSKKQLLKRGVRVIEDSVTTNEIAVKAIPVLHGETKCNAYIIQNEDEILFFATDFVKFCNLEDLKLVLSTNFNTIMIECNYLDSLLENASDSIKTKRQINTHLSLNGCLAYLSKMNLNNCKAIYLMHLSDKYSDELIMQAQVYSQTKLTTYVCKKNGGFI